MRYIGRWEFEAVIPLRSHGIWDCATGQWVARHLTLGDATWQAAALSLRFDGTGERPASRSRYLDPPIHVELRITPSRTEIALLQMWSREPDGWQGYATYLEREPGYGGRWAAAAALRPLSLDEVTAFLDQQRARRRIPVDNSGRH